MGTQGKLAGLRLLYSRELAIRILATPLLGSFGERSSHGQRNAEQLSVQLALSEAERASCDELYTERCSSCHGAGLVGAVGPS